MTIADNEPGTFYVLVESGDDDPVDEIPTIYDYREAMDRAKQLAVQVGPEEGVCLHEYGRFKSSGKKIETYVAIWWNDTFGEVIGQKPKGRGYGFFMPQVGRKRWIEYEPYCLDPKPRRTFSQSDLLRSLPDQGYFIVGYQPKPNIPSPPKAKVTRSNRVGCAPQRKSA
jgi:hypothetical protein